MLDQPGCYVIVTSPSPDGKAYENVYVGQSLYVCSRVRNHLTGHGNGDVYADVRNGKPVFVKIVPCPAQQMNALEKKLIKAFNATSSYNNTAGGSRFSAQSCEQIRYARLRNRRCRIKRQFQE